MVDVVLYLEHHQHSSISSSSSSANNNGNQSFRWLRAQKNRFGSCQTVGLYEFLDTGRLQPQPEGLQNLYPPTTDIEGSAFAIGMEGSQRAMTVEVQALVTLASSGFSKKTVEGIPLSRLNLVLGILQKHCQLNIAGSSSSTRGGGISRDVYINVVGGVSKSQQVVTAPTLDLAVAVALTSSFVNIPVRGDTVLLAQVGLLGELRPIPSLEVRLQQAQRMGFSRAIVAGGGTRGGSKPRRNNTARGGGSSTRQYDMDILECSTVKDALDLALLAKLPTTPRRTSRTSSPTSIVEGTPSPASIKDLFLEEDIILDDEEDELDVI
jgi:predicted ATP-dependent serine protease